MPVTDEETRARKAAWQRKYRAANKDKLAAYHRARYQQDREKRLAYEATPERRASRALRQKKWRAENRELSRLQIRAWNYGLTIEQVREMLDRGCDACGSKERLTIDHDHSCCAAGASPRSCGKCVRGPLCTGCNSAAGHLGEDPERAEKLAVHLRKRVK